MFKEGPCRTGNSPVRRVAGIGTHRFRYTCLYTTKDLLTELGRDQRASKDRWILFNRLDLANASDSTLVSARSIGIEDT